MVVIQPCRKSRIVQTSVHGHPSRPHSTHSQLMLTFHAAEKYKLYKKLSKRGSVASKPSANIPDPPAHPSTPPRSVPKPSSILPKSRAVKTEAPTVTSNPFSPVKNKGKHKQRFPRDSSPPVQPSPINPFATPRKTKSKAESSRRNLSPDPFPLIHSVQKSQSVQVSNSQPLSAASHAVLRARKRLRGEPVSPSPVKEKRARVGFQSTIPFTMPTSLLEDSDISDTENHSRDREDGPVIEDTPMKPQTGGKAFIQLFQESSVSQEPTTRSYIHSQPRAKSSSSGLFGNRKGKSRALSPDSGEEETFWNGKLKPPKFSSTSLAGRNPKQQKNGLPHAVLPGKDDLWLANGQSLTPFSNLAPNPALPTSSNLEDKLSPTKQLPTSKVSGLLLPPSPPPPESAKFSSSRYLEKSRGKAGKLGLGAKKLKALNELRGDDSAEGSSSDNELSQVKMVDWRERKRNLDGTDKASTTTDADVGWDSAPHRARLLSDAPFESDIDPGVLEVSLPDDLKRVLALSQTDTRHKDDTEDKVAKELLYGSRIRNYNAVKGGEIWDIGECEGEEGLSGREDDWEGEPVPWEVGEL